jgi:hypothetical protein
LSELQDWQDIAKIREDKIRELEANVESLRHDKRILTVRCFYIQEIRLTSLQQNVPSSEAVSGTEIYKALIERISYLEYILKEKESQVNSSVSEDPKTPSHSESNDEELVRPVLSLRVSQLHLHYRERRSVELRKRSAFKKEADYANSGNS